MGTVTNQSRLQFLTVRLHNLDASAQQISEQKRVLMSQAQSANMNYSNSAGGVAMGSQSDSVEWQLDDTNGQMEDFDFNFEAPQVNENANNQVDEEKLKEISEQEKMLDMQMIQINMERKAVSTEYDSVKKLIKEDQEKEQSST